MHVAVIGARGQLGAAIVHEFSSKHDVTALDRSALDVTDEEAVGAMMKRLGPDVIVNCAAYNAVDAAEDHPVEALRTNAFGVRAIARATHERQTVLVHYSSDFVFDGTTTKPHTEEERPNPRSVYATSKLLGEWFAADAADAYVLRVESLFGRAPNGPQAHGSVASIVNNLRHGVPTRVFGDRTVSPTFILDAARATRELVERHAPASLYHCVNSGWCTWADFAREAARLLGVEPRLEIIKLADTYSRAPRPLYCALSNDKLASVGVVMPTWRDALARYIRTL